MAAAAPNPGHQQPLQRDVVVIGASAGGVEALGRLVAGLPPDLPAAVLVVLHVLPGGRSVLGNILTRAGRLPATTAAHGTRIERGRIYVAPPDHHLILQGETLRLSRGPRENGHRPAIDLLFRSAAESRGPRTLGVVLTGLLDDGAAGLRIIKELGGAAVVQSPDDAAYPAMPLNALAATDADAVVPLDQMATTIGRLLAGSAAGTGSEAETPIGPASTSRANVAEALATVESAPADAVEVAAATAVDAVRGPAADLYRRPTLVEQDRTLESTLSGALRTLEERAALLRRLARGSSGITRRRFEQRSRQAEAHANYLRDTLPATVRAPADGVDGAIGGAS